MTADTELMDFFAALGRKLVHLPEHEMELELEAELLIRGYAHRPNATRQRCQREARREWWNTSLRLWPNGR